MDTNLQAEPRKVLGKKVKVLRRQGLVPANVYGNRLDPVPVQLAEHQVNMRVARASRSTLFALALQGTQAQTVLVKELQRHPTSGRVLHIDFLRVNLDEKLRTRVPLHVVGTAPAVKDFEGVLVTPQDSVEVEALPADLPTSIEVDVSGIKSLQDAIHVGDLTVGPGVTILSAAEDIVATVTPSAVSVEEEEEVAEEEAADEEAAEGEAPPTEPSASSDDATR